MLLTIRLTIRNFFKKHAKKIIIALAVWIVILVINYFVGKWSENDIDVQTNYTPHESVMGNGDVPIKLRSKIEELIGKFVENCNNKDYEAAYNMLTEDCKNNIYSDMELFKKYVDSIFDKKKIYNIQNFSNKDNTYIYTVNILNDILASGINNADDELIYSEKYVVVEENGELKLSIRQYIGRNDLSYFYEDEYMKIKIQSVDIKYDNIVYNLNITNKTENNYIVFANYEVDYEVSLDTSQGLKRRADNVLRPIELWGGESGDFSVQFTVFYDDTIQINGMIFDYIRIYEDVEAYENGDKPIDDFAIEVKF